MGVHFLVLKESNSSFSEKRQALRFRPLRYESMLAVVMVEAIRRDFLVVDLSRTGLAIEGNVEDQDCLALGLEMDCILLGLQQNGLRIDVGVVKVVRTWDCDCGKGFGCEVVQPNESWLECCPYS